MEIWISAIASTFSAVAAITSVFVAIIIGKAQSKQEKKAQQIAMFDKRYEIYQSTLRVLSLAKLALLENKYYNVPNYIFVADKVLSEYGLMENKSFLTQRMSIQRELESSSKESREKADRDYYYLDYRANNDILQLREKVSNTIKSTRFCFDEKIYNSLYPCMVEFFDYISIFKNGNAQEYERDKTLLEKYLLVIESEKIIERMEEYLSL